MNNKCPKCNQESLSFEDQNNDILDTPYCFECSDFIYEYKDKDNINPDHYKDSEIECIDAIESSMSKEAFKGYLKGNIIKYVWRYEQKNGVEDLKKARWYLARLVFYADD